MVFCLSTQTHCPVFCETQPILHVHYHPNRPSVFAALCFRRAPTFRTSPEHVCVCGRASAQEHCKRFHTELCPNWFLHTLRTGLLALLGARTLLGALTNVIDLIPHGCNSKPFASDGRILRRGIARVHPPNSTQKRVIHQAHVPCVMGY